MQKKKINTSIYNLLENENGKNNNLVSCSDCVYAKNRVSTSLIPDIKNVIFNDPATIVLWSDGSKTVVKAQDGEPYDAEKGLAMAVSKKALGNKGNYCNVFKKWLPEEDESRSINIEFNGEELLKRVKNL